MSVLEWFCDVDDFMLRFAPSGRRTYWPQASSETARASYGPVR